MGVALLYCRIDLRALDQYLFTTTNTKGNNTKHTKILCALCENLCVLCGLKKFNKVQNLEECDATVVQ